MSLVEVNNVSLTYHEESGETLAIKDISLSVEKGEFVAIVGPSGSGKTTLLSIIAGISEANFGQVRLDGAQVKDQRARIGYMLQHDHLLSFRSIYKNALLGLEVKGLLNDESKEYAKTLLKRYGLYEFKDSFPRQLSGGMRQKAALIRTLAFEPTLLLLDEPFSALDYQTRLKLSNEVSAIIRNECKTAILVTHDISEAISMSDRIYVFSNRPATIKAVHDIDLYESYDIFERRKNPRFKVLFDTIWRELNEDS